MTPIPISVITSIKEDTPADYKLLTTGFAVTVGNVMANNLKVRFYSSVFRIILLILLKSRLTVQNGIKCIRP